MDIPESMLKKTAVQTETNQLSRSSQASSTSRKIKTNQPNLSSRPNQVNLKIKHKSPMQSFEPLPPPPPSLLPASTIDCMLKFRQLKRNHTVVQQDFNQLKSAHHTLVLESRISISCLGLILFFFVIFFIVSQFLWCHYHKKKKKEIEDAFRERIKNIVKTPSCAIKTYNQKGSFYL